MIQKNLFTKQKDSKISQWNLHSYQRGNVGGRMYWEVRWHIHTTVWSGGNQDLLYSLGKSIRYSAMAYMGKESKKVWIYKCMYVWLIHLAAHLKVTQPCKSPILQQICWEKERKKERKREREKERNCQVLWNVPMWPDLAIGSVSHFLDFPGPRRLTGQCAELTEGSCAFSEPSVPSAQFPQVI